MWSLSANIINCFLWTVRNDFSRKNLCLRMGKISGKHFQAILERQLENNIEEFEVSDEDKHLRWSHDF